MIKQLKIKVTRAITTADLAAVYTVRRRVFVDEQHCPPALESEFDEASAHFLASADDMPAGAARWRETTVGYKLERFAVLAKFRGTGVGHALVKAVLADIPANAGMIYLHSQTQAVPFYQKLNFIKDGEEFEEAGIMHFKMVFNASN